MRSDQARATTPPAGPVASTPGPEPRTAVNAASTPGDADSLYRITQPGSYYLTENLAGVCDTLVRIPQAGRADSLNLAVATGVMLFEIRRGALSLSADHA